MDCYLDLLIRPIRDEQITAKFALHLTRFLSFFVSQYKHDAISTCLKRDVVAWQTHLAEDLALAPATVNNHLASLSGFMSWVYEQNNQCFPAGNPCKGVSQLPLPALEPRALTKKQVHSLKNLCDRLPRLRERQGQRYQQRRRNHPETAPEAHAHTRPWRDRAIVYILLATGVRREELINLNLNQVQPHTPAELRTTQIAKMSNVYGKGKSRRNLYLSADARSALADYLEYERPTDAAHFSLPQALFLRAASVCFPAQTSYEERNGRLATRSINRILERIGLLYDAEYNDPAHHLSPLRPHNLRH